MGYVRSRKFCCCLPVRFGVFCSALLGVAYSTAFSVLAWIEVHRHATHQLDLGKDEVVGLVLFALAYTFMLLFSIMGRVNMLRRLIGSIGGVRGFVKGYGISLTINTAITIGIGIFWCWRLFHTDRNSCSIQEENDADKVAHWVCQKGFDIIRIVLVIVMVLVWIFQIAGCAIVFDYVGQLNEELEMDQQAYGAQDAPEVNPYPAPAGTMMRTTYDAQATPIMKSAYEQGNWQDGAKPQYPFTQPENAYGREGV
ncbi:predicted protein [Postia placenta Mad-698-R]|uniref:Uncharacterized protein n=1 Tax=Postia placenta MAD-698-R-SB12 TaxID=670580 RepID=A0A1X6N095_9APHY|nr:hypothetical protein POSPLADRAFT_1056631 [Postia placenta MAD-698-R-SB12]EED79206.1 predicted protein [Postia placenta Mad-698-R]OSX62038.1 hypothetical protein POSPLADRAFT_1056631 [Postia placenta MAD-698-R-SB12]